MEGLIFGIYGIFGRVFAFEWYHFFFISFHIEIACVNSNVFLVCFTYVFSLDFCLAFMQLCLLIYEPQTENTPKKSSATHAKENVF